MAYHYVQLRLAGGAARGGAVTVVVAADSARGAGRINHDMALMAKAAVPLNCIIEEEGGSCGSSRKEDNDDDEEDLESLLRTTKQQQHALHTLASALPIWYEAGCPH
jgi:hypothetical protein